jgi:hypothetical protein
MTKLQKQYLFVRLALYFALIAGCFILSVVINNNGYGFEILFILLIIIIAIIEIGAQSKKKNTAHSDSEIKENSTPLVTAGIFYDNLESILAKNLLESNGTNAKILNGNISNVDPLLISAVGGIKVLVKEEDLNKAVDLLNQYKTEINKKPTACPKCGENDFKEINSNIEMKLPFVLLTGTPARYNLHYKCNKCGNIWKPELPE